MRVVREAEGGCGPSGRGRVERDRIERRTDLGDIALAVDTEFGLMDLPGWVLEIIKKFLAPETGRVTIVLDRYMGGVTQAEIGASVRMKRKDVEERGG